MRQKKKSELEECKGTGTGSGNYHSLSTYQGQDTNDYRSYAGKDTNGLHWEGGDCGMSLSVCHSLHHSIMSNKQVIIVFKEQEFLCCFKS